MTEESGVQASLTQEEIKDYLEQVLKEVKKDTKQISSYV